MLTESYTTGRAAAHASRHESAFRCPEPSGRSPFPFAALWTFGALPATLYVGSLDCLSPSLSPHATKTQRTTVADPEKQYLLGRDLSHVTGLAGVGCIARNRD
jgi:hypothetical protein